MNYPVKALLFMSLIGVQAFAWADRVYDQKVSDRLQAAIEHELSLITQNVEDGSIEIEIEDLELDGQGLRNLKIASNATAQVEDISVKVEKTIHFRNQHDGSAPVLTVTIDLETDMRMLIGANFDLAEKHIRGSQLSKVKELQKLHDNDELDYMFELKDVRYGKRTGLEHLLVHHKLSTVDQPDTGLEGTIELTPDSLHACYKLVFDPELNSRISENKHLDTGIDRLFSHEPDTVIPVDIRRAVKKAVSDLSQVHERFKRR